jgi:hypothetical protein
MSEIATSPQLDGMDGVYCADCETARALPSDDSTEILIEATRTFPNTQVANDFDRFVM